MNPILWKKFHNWIGISSALFLTILLGTGLLLNHPSHLRSKEIETIQLNPKDSKEMYRGGPSGFFHSIDGGKNWEEVSMLYPPQEVVDIEYSPLNPHTVYLLEKWGRLLVSKEGGHIWNEIHLPFDPQSNGIELKKIAVSQDGTLLLLTSNGWLIYDSNQSVWNETHFQKDRRPLYRLVLTLHNGYFFGPSFVWVYDATAVALLLLIWSGFILWNRSRKIG